MLTTTVDEALKYDYYNDRFKAAFKFLQETDFSQYNEPCEIPIIGRDVYAQVQLYTTKPVEECKFEAHRVYYDIQYMADGEEYMGFTPLKNLEEDTGYDAGNDLEFFKMPKTYGRLYLQTGDFAVVSPEDGHMPRCIGEKSRPVKKIVVKVRVK